MKLFTIGPVEMYPYTKKTDSRQLPYFRCDEFSRVMLSIERRLKRILGLQDGRAVMLTGSGTAAMEAVVSCALDETTRVLVINGGNFGARFSSLCDIHRVPHDDIHLEFGEILTREKLSQYDPSAYRAILVNLHETSTGQLYDITLLKEYSRQHGMYLIVDAISSFLADPLHMEDDGVDCVILSSQKALALSPGIAMVAMTSKFYQKMVEPKEDHQMYLSIKEHVKNMDRGQTPYTPAIGVLLEMEERLSHIEEEGLDHAMQEIWERALYFRKKAHDIGLCIPEYPLSHALTPIVLRGNAYEVFMDLKEHHDVYVTPSGGAWKDQLLRIGHLGNLTLEDYDMLCELLKEYAL